MPTAVSLISAPLLRKIASMKEIREVFIPSIPREMAIKASGELSMHELNFGNPSDIGNVAVEIGRISGNLARSFGYIQISQYQWAVSQTLAIAPYAADVAVYSHLRFGMTYLDSVRRRTHDYLRDGVKEEWEYAWDRVNNDKPYKYHPLFGVSG